MVPATGVPPCCTRCAAYDHADRVCLLLTEPTVEHRRRLFAMPCDVQRLLQLRFRTYGGDVAQEALIAWLDPSRPAPLPRERLVVLHNGQSHDVPSSGFIIGRGKLLAGLGIRDPNISRRHAVIEEENGAYYLVDLGSTNGTHLNGTSIQLQVIREGDVARIADEELIFTFRR